MEYGREIVILLFTIAAGISYLIGTKIGGIQADKKSLRAFMETIDNLQEAQEAAGITPKQQEKMNASLRKSIRKEMKQSA